MHRAPWKRWPTATRVAGSWSQFPGQHSFPLRGSRTGVGNSIDQSGQHAADIGVQHDLASTVREAPDGRRRVGADSRQSQQRLAILRHLALELVHDHLRSLVQPQCSSGVAETTPGTHGVARRRCSKRCGCGPPLHPGLPWAAYPLDRSLLQHELADHGRPRCRSGASPRQIPRVPGVPAQDPANSRPGFADRQLFLLDAG